jgi:hypothetical protein
VPPLEARNPVTYPHTLPFRIRASAKLRIDWISSAHLCGAVDWVPAWSRSQAVACERRRDDGEYALRDHRHSVPAPRHRRDHRRHGTQSHEHLLFLSAFTQELVRERMDAMLHAHLGGPVDWAPAAAGMTFVGRDRATPRAASAIALGHR